MTKARNLARLASVNTSIVGNTILLSGNVSLANATLSFGANTINSTSLTSTGVVANSYGNTTAIPVITVDAAGRITNATTSSVSGVTGLSFAPANSTITVSTSTTNFDAVVTSGNSTVQGLLTVIDSVSNTSTLIAGSANSVTTAYLLAANAVSNATAYAATAYSNAVATAASDATTKAGTAYSNAISYANTAAGTAYSNAVSVASSDATTKAGTAYSNATTFATTAAGTAYSNAVSVASSDATTKAGTAYSNATTYAATIAGTAYSNAVSVAASDATTKAGTAYSNATTYAATIAGTAYSNAVSVASSDATTKAGTAYSNAIAYANTVAYTAAGTAYSNVFNGGTFSGAVTVQANLTANSVRMNGDLQIDGNLTVSGNSVTINVTNLNVDDNMIYLNSNSTVSHPDLGFAGNYNDGSYKHAGLFRDATDGVWKFFHGYTPEPDASAFIDTANASFTFSNLQINYVIGNVTGSANSATYLGGNTASTLRTYSDTIAGTAYSNATTYAATIAGTAYSNAVSVAASDATTKAGTAYSNATTYAATIAGTAYSNATTYAATIAGTAYSNATTYAATIAGTAYSNATAFAANASNISSGTLSASRLPATYLTSVTGTAPVVSSGGATPAISMAAANSTVAGYMTTTYASKLDGIASGATNVTNNNQLTNGAGYITGYTETDTLATVTGRGSSTTVNSIAIGDSGADTGLRINNGAGSSDYGRIRFYQAGTNYQTIHVFSSNWQSGTLQSSSAGAINITGLNGVTFGAWNDSAMWISTAGDAQAKLSLRAPIFYDSNNTSYYVDPNAGGLYLAGGTSNRVIFSTTDSGYLVYNAEGNGATLRLGAAWTYPGIYNGGSIYVMSEAEVYFRTQNVNRGYIDSSSNMFAFGSMRSPIFYDYNDTGYYIDPNSTGVALRIAGAIQGNHTAWTGEMNKIQWHSSHLYFQNTSDGNFTFRQANGNEPFILTIGSAFGTAQGSWRAPIFYDSNDTSYYIDPNSTSELSGLSNGTKVRAGLNIHYHNRQANTGDTNYWVGSQGWGSTYNLDSCFVSLGSCFFDHWGATAHPRGSVHCQGIQALHYRTGAVAYGFQLVNGGDGNPRMFTRAAWGGGGGTWYELAMRNYNVSGDFYSSIYYDSDDTGYYVNPNGGSQLQGHTRFGPLAGHASSGNVSGVEIRNNGGTGDGDVACISWHCAGYFGLQMHLRHDGYFGIGGWSATSWRWYSNTNNGDMTAVGNVTAYSDPRLKEDVKVIESAIDKIKQLNGVKFRWIESSVIGHPGEYDYGILSTDVEKIAPELVINSIHEAPEGDFYKTVAYDKLVAFTIEAIKEQQTIIESQEARIAKLEALINKLVG